MTIKDHYYIPDYQAMGDCRTCGHGQKKPWHIGEMLIEDRMKRVDESLARQLERSIRLNCELRISIWDEAIETAAQLLDNESSSNPADKIRKLKKCQNESQ